MTRRHTSTIWGSAAVNPLELNRERVRELTQLCHPDKHAGSALSMKVIQWLGECRKELDKRGV